MRRKILETSDLFNGFIDKSVTVRFGEHAFQSRLHEVGVARMSDVVNTSDEYIITGIMKITFEDGTLYFVMDDVENILLTVYGIRVIMCNGNCVEFSCES